LTEIVFAGFHRCLSSYMNRSIEFYCIQEQQLQTLSYSGNNGIAIQKANMRDEK